MGDLSHTSSGLPTPLRLSVALASVTNCTAATELHRQYLHLLDIMWFHTIKSFSEMVYSVHPILQTLRLATSWPQKELTCFLSFLSEKWLHWLGKPQLSQI